MLCQECHNAPASVHVKKRQGDEEVQIHLCPACAKKMGWHNPLEDIKFPLAQFISSMMHDMTLGAAQKPAPGEGARCTECGLSFQEFSRTGRLGCGHCYEAFRSSMQELLRRIHGSTRHEGRRPKNAPKPARTSKATSLRQLKAELDRAVAAEDFEKAAEIRDRIRQAQKSKESKESKDSRATKGAAK
jgi:protein arginine kinase activator